MRQALELALEALQMLHDENMDYLTRNKLGGENNQCMVFAREAITAIKETLAQPEQKPVAWMHVMDNTEGLKANGTGIVSITQKRKHPFGKSGVDFDKSYLVTSTPLYTTPLQRKPLTDEEITKEVEAELTHYWDGEYIDTTGARDQLTAFARAIEAAHGIKE